MTPYYIQARDADGYIAPIKESDVHSALSSMGLTPTFSYGPSNGGMSALFTAPQYIEGAAVRIGSLTYTVVPDPPEPKGSLP